MEDEPVMTSNRHTGNGAQAPQLAAGYALERVLAPSALWGANGMRFGPDGRLFVAQAFGSQVSAVDPRGGAISTICPMGGDILAPDDLAFDSHGTMYVTEVFSARVSAREPGGRIRVLAADLPVANGITVFQDRVFIDEFRVDGRVLELFTDGRAPRVIASGLTLPNALSAGPDGCLYFPLVLNGEIARVPIAGGPVEVFAAGLQLPTAVKFDAKGRLVVVQAGSGEISAFDLPSRQATTIGRVRPGIDNLAFAADGGLYVSNFTDGGISRIGADGAEDVLVERGLLGPFGLATAPDGSLILADGMSYASLTPSGQVLRPSMLLNHGFPGYVRGAAVGADGTLYFGNSAGGVASFAPGAEAAFLATGLDQVMGLAADPAGGVIACEAGAGRLLALRSGNPAKVLARGLQRPTAVAVAADGSLYVSEAAGHRVVRCRDGVTTTVLDGLDEPHGLTIAGEDLYALDRGGRSLHRVSLRGGTGAVVARGLPVGAAAGVTPKPLPGIPGVMPGPLLPFADLATAADGAVLVGGDGEGSLLRIRRGAAPT